MRQAVGQRNDHDRPVLLMFPEPALAGDSAYRMRFWAEANNSRRLTGRRVAPVIDISPPEAQQPWVAYDSFPALPLRSAISDFPEGMPEPTALELAAALAEALLGIHTHGLVHAGLDAATLLLTPTGPQVTGYGLQRAAVPVGGAAAPISTAALHAGLPPEHTTDHVGFQPPGDIYMLGAVVAYAATGVAVTSAAQLPASLSIRDVLAECMAADPGARPRADVLLRQLQDRGATGHFHVLEPVASALQEQREAHQSTAAAQRVLSPSLGEGVDETGVPLSAAPDRRELGRRNLLRGAAAGAAGLALGGGAVGAWRLMGSNGEDKRRQLSVSGTAPSPLWYYEAQGEELGDSLLLSAERLMLFSSTDGTVAVDLRDGRQVWSRDDVLSDIAPLSVGSMGVLFSDTEKLQVVSPRTGSVNFSLDKYGSGKPVNFSSPLATRQSTLWFSAENLEASDEDRQYMVIAYDFKKRKELWRQYVPKDYARDSFSTEEDSAPSLVKGKELLIPNSGLLAESDWLSYLSLDVRTGRKLWTRGYKGVDSSSALVCSSVGDGIVIAGVDKSLKAYGLKSGSERWSFPLGGMADEEVVWHGKTGYASSGKSGIYGLDLRNGRKMWHQNPFTVADKLALGELALSGSGQTLFYSAESEIGAMSAKDGTPQWRMATVGAGWQSGESGKVIAATTGMTLVAGNTTLYALPVD
ncbi:PQQ-binding-like beta-propeller repeat protein [Streptomyces sp. ODS28]|uniref:outer membrane protein assembly factor BamB family protein n=1 Tax=Streptomyces sp. ODS28 TaxID=3136688 RepID=UPI0031F03599